MEDGGLVLMRERERRKLFWIEVNLIRLFFSWLRGYGGKIFQEDVHALWIAPLYPSLLDELRHFALSTSSAGARITLDKARYDVWESVSTEHFEFFGASFVALALDLCRYSEVEDAPMAVGWDQLDSFLWNRPMLDSWLGEFRYGLKRQNESGTIVVDREAIDLRLCEMHRQLKLHDPVSSQHELVEVSRDDVFDLSAFNQAVEVLKYILRHTSISDADRQGPMKLPMPPQLAEELPVDLAIVFALNSNKQNVMKPLSSAGLEQLESWLWFRMGTIHQALPFRIYQACQHHSSRSSFKLLLAPLFLSAFTNKIELVWMQDVKAADGDFQVGRPLVTIASRGFNELVTKMEVHSSVLELECSETTVIMARLFHSWLRCCGGQFKHKLMVDQISKDYTLMGWPPCKNLSLLQEELRSWKCSDIWSNVENFWEDSYDYMVPDYYSADFPGAMRHYVEHHLAKATIVLCKDVTEPVLRTLYTWQRHHDFGSLGTADPKALESLMYCSYLHGGSNLLEATEQDLKECTYATSTDTVALVIGECQVGALVHRRIVCMDDKTSGE
ncbi:hypothetical protein SELMODRAFT_419182 [Selaginella moellendorffii]|uniref:Uncharacterized protein n=1 Tax=Selaginella moellendorffii TaxID=88036 RepID=D8S841_SELML|nr:hypothetical protein SELMODRAFT_419182 [Selaginella moellendorffii]